MKEEEIEKDLNNEFSSIHDDVVKKQNYFKYEESDRNSESIRDRYDETITKSVNNEVEVSSGVKVVEDAGTSLTRAVNSLNKCEILLMSLSEDANDKDLVAFMCKIKDIKTNLDNLLTEFTRLRPSYLSALGAIKENQDDLLPQIMLDLVKTELPLDEDFEGEFNEDHEEFDNRLGDDGIDELYDDNEAEHDKDVEDDEFLPPISAIPSEKRRRGKSKVKHKLGGKKRTRKHCEVCDLAFSSKEEYKTHLKECKRERNLKCDHCDELFLSKRSLRIHSSKAHKSDLRHECEVCNQEFGCKKDLTRHKTQERHYNEDQKVHCDKCNKVLMNLKSYQDHINNYHSRSHKCDMCDEAFDASKELRDHLKVQHDVKPLHPCKSCGEAFPSVTALHAHLNETNHSNFTCEVCSKAFNSESTLKSHVKNLHSKSLPCDTCGESFDGKMALKRHKTTKHLMQDDQFVCPECGFTTKSRAYFKHHLLIHGTRRHKCEHCDKAFHSKNDLKVHNRVHTGEKPYVCQICGTRFRKNGGLSRHKLVHTGEKPYVCYLCGKGFNQKGNLKTHMKSHISGTQRLHHPAAEIKEDI